MDAAEVDRRHMLRALELARQGEGLVEPNPQVGCVLVRDGRVVGEGWHPRFGGPHAEIEALRAAGEAARGTVAYVTLEPCRHHGKTPPCSEALIAAGVSRVVAAVEDPNPLVAGRGIAALRTAGIETSIGVCAAEAADLIAPFAKLMTARRPWVIAKWAMTLDGKIAAVDGSSQWISGEPSRTVVHGLRGRVDAIIAGIGTVLADDPLLTARPAGSRVALRVILDGQARLPLENRLVQTARETPVLLVAGSSADANRVAALEARGVEVLTLPGDSSARLAATLDELGRRQSTNVLVEGGSQVLGSFLAAEEIDEVHVFIAPKLLGGAAAASPVGGPGLPTLAAASLLRSVESKHLGDDFYLRGRLTKRDSSSRHS